MTRTLAAVLSLALVIAACGDDTATPPSSSPGDAVPLFPEGAFAFSASSVLAVGEERLLVAVSNPSGARLASQDVPVTISVWPEGHSDLAHAEAGIFTWALEGVSGLYRAVFTFDEPGTWLVVVTPDGGEPLDPFGVTVQAESPVPAVGEPAPRSDSPTGDEFELGDISTDPEPDPRFYELSVAEAVTNGRPSVIVFATPAFCQTAVCGPTLDTVKGIVGEHPDVDFVHVEVYTNLDDPENLQLAPAVTEWGLPSEPWVFVVDAAGVVRARFEGVITPGELSAALRES